MRRISGIWNDAVFFATTAGLSRILIWLPWSQFCPFQKYNSWNSVLWLKWPTRSQYCWRQVKQKSGKAENTKFCVKCHWLDQRQKLCLKNWVVGASRTKILFPRSQWMCSYLPGKQASWTGKWAFVANDQAKTFGFLSEPEDIIHICHCFSWTEHGGNATHTEVCVSFWCQHELNLLTRSFVDRVACGETVRTSHILKQLSQVFFC